LTNENNYNHLQELYDDYYKVLNFNAKKYIKNVSSERVFDIINTFNDLNIDSKSILIKDTLYHSSFDKIHDDFKKEIIKLNKVNCIIVLKSQKANDYCQPCNITKLSYYEHIKYGIINKIIINNTNEFKNITFQLPNKNKYISVDDDICNDENISYPGCNIYLYRTNKYKHSDINIRLNIKFGSIIDDLENRLFICVYLNALETQLNTELYKMNNASYYINLSYDYKNTAEYEISIYGNRGKIFEVFNYIIQNIGIKVEKKYIDLQIEKIKKLFLFI
jgi:hypothetical protein